MPSLAAAYAGINGDKLTLLDIELTVFRSFPFVMVVLT